MGKYDRQIAMAQRMIRDKGRLVTWRQPGPPNVGGTAAKPAARSTPNDFVNVPMVFLPGKSESFATLLSALAPDMPEIPASGVKALMPVVVGLTPSLNDYVFAGDTTWHLMPKHGIEVLAPDGEPVLYYLRFQR